MLCPPPGATLLRDLDLSGNALSLTHADVADVFCRMRVLHTLRVSRILQSFAPAPQPVHAAPASGASSSRAGGGGAALGLQLGPTSDEVAESVEDVVQRDSRSMAALVALGRAMPWLKIDLEG